MLHLVSLPHLNSNRTAAWSGFRDSTAVARQVTVSTGRDLVLGTSARASAQLHNIIP